MQFFDWELRPAIITATGAWCIPKPGGKWVKADAAEIIDSGRRLTEQAFDQLYPNAGRPT